MSAWRRGGSGVVVFLIEDLLFMRADKQPTVRQLYALTELRKPEGQPTRAPEFMRLRVAPEQPRIEGEVLDFRDEIMAQIFDKGDPTPQRSTPNNHKPGSHEYLHQHLRI